MGLVMAVVLKAQALADANGWTLKYAEGFIDGEICRRKSENPPKYISIGIDDYAQGYRAGFFIRRESNAPAMYSQIVRVGVEPRAAANSMMDAQDNQLSV
jgi:hypothetical protein